MRIAFLCKRRYMSKDVILDRYARLYEIPHQLARLGHEVNGYCLDYHSSEVTGEWQHEAGPGSLIWHSRSIGRLRAPISLLNYPRRLLGQLREISPDILIGASDIPHVVLTARLARRLKVPYLVDLYDNFEGFGQANIPGFVKMLRHAVREADMVTTTSEPLKQIIVDEYQAKGKVIAMPSSVDKAVFYRQDKIEARDKLGLPLDAKLIGTAGGLYREKGVEPLYSAWERIAEQQDVRLVLAGPQEPGFPAPEGERVHYLGNLAHDQVATLFNALDVGIISILDTPFGRYCFPQKAYEMLACGLPVVAAEIGAMTQLLEGFPQLLFQTNNTDALAEAVIRQLEYPVQLDIPISDWRQLIEKIEPQLGTLFTSG